MEKLRCGRESGGRGDCPHFRIFLRVGGRLQPRHDQPLSNYLSETCPPAFRYRYVIPKHVAGSFRSAGNGFPLAKHGWPSSTGDRNEIVTIEFDRFVSCALSTRLPDQLPTADALILFPTAFAPQSRGIFFSPIESYRVKAHVCASIPSDL